MQHGGTKSDGPTLPEPTHAERARTLVRRGGATSTLCTLSAHESGYPFGSVAPYADNHEGEPLVLISTMAMHTQNLKADPRCTLLISESAGMDLGAGRVSLIGDAQPVTDDEHADARERYLQCNPPAAQWIDFDDFSLWKIRLANIYFVGGFGVMGWVHADDYRSAEPDPLMDVSAGIISHMNEDHADALVKMCGDAGYQDVREAALTAVDRLGFHARLLTEAGPRGARINFPNEVRSADECRQAFIAMARA